jgi:REP-associated tyrosine transposase
VPRPPRLQAPGAAYHATAKGCADRSIYLDDADRAAFESILAGVIQRHAWSCEALCLMTTHYHLMVTTPQGDLAAGMQRLNGLYARTFNRRHGFEGHLFHRRYHAELIQTGAHQLEVCRYIALNPVRAGLCEHPAEWPWGSYAETIGERSSRPFLATWSLLRLFGDDVCLARSRLQVFVEDGLSMKAVA